MIISIGEFDNGRVLCSSIITQLSLVARILEDDCSIARATSDVRLVVVMVTSGSLDCSMVGMVTTGLLTFLVLLCHGLSPGAVATDAGESAEAEVG